MSLLTQPSELKHNQPISCLIYGQPGTGKTTLALSADKPVLIDLDRGLYRVEKRFQCPSLQVENYQQILDLINSDELRPFNTIVIDTLGKLVDRMGDFVARQNPKFKQGDGTLSMKAWGAIKIQFAALVKQIFNSNKSVIPPHLVEEVLSKKGYIIADRFGKFDVQRFSRYFKKIRDILGFDERYIFKNMRHTGSTAYVEAGVATNAIISITGHTNEAIFNQVYKGNTEEVTLPALKKRLEAESRNNKIKESE